MRKHTNNYKKKLIGVREFNMLLYYEENNEKKYISEDDIELIKPILNTDLFKTLMKQLELELKYELPKGTIVHFKNGLKIDENYEYIDYGNYIVYETEYNADTKTYTHICYDNMLKTMTKYEPLNITYPISVRNYISSIALACGLGFAKFNKQFVNYNVNIPKDYFSEGNYTYRDILDYLCEIVGGWLYIDNSDRLDIKYPTETNDVLNEDYLNAINVSFDKKYGPVNSIVFARANELDNIEYKDDASIQNNGLHRVKFSNNPFLSGEDRENFFTQELKDKIMGLEFYYCDIESKGITYLELGDMFEFALTLEEIQSLKSGTIKSGVAKMQGETLSKYKCLMLNDEQEFRKGLTEKIYNEDFEQNEEEYITTAPTDNSIKNAEILVNKSAGEIVLKANSDGQVVQARLDADADDGSLFEIQADNISLAGKTIDLTADNINIDSTNFKVDENGTVQATNGEFSGEISASTGNISGWQIDNNGLNNGNVFIHNDGSSTLYTVADLVIVRNYIMGITGFNLSTSMINHYDFNNDGQVTAADYIILQNLIGISMDN